MHNTQQRPVDADFEEMDVATAVDGPSEIATRPVPTWFPQSFKALPADDMAQHYRSQRAEPPRERYAPRQYIRDYDRGYDPEIYRVPARRAAQAEPLEARALPLHRPASSRAAAYVAAGFAAALVGGAIGYGMTHYQSLEALMMPAPQAAATPTAAKDNSTIVTKKPIDTATLEVSDVTGDLGSMIPLMLHAAPATAGQDLVLRISGLPASAYLTAGAKSADNGWQLKASEADGVKLVVPQTAQPKFDVAIAAFETKTGQLAAPIKEITVAIADPGVKIAPASALPDGVSIKSAPIPVPKQVQTASVEAQDLTAKGDILLKSGDMAMARQFYERAFAQGSIPAAIGAGKTYDPAVYAELKVQGLKPDPVRAMEWYMRASAAGSADAAGAIEGLKQATQ